MSIRSLYVHFPFCETKCHYCDFYSLGRERTRSGDADTFEAALRSEAQLASETYDLAPELDTLFFGGGTPSMTPPDSMKRALEPLWKKTQPSSTAEWTMEANPSSVNLETLKGYRSLGVNRVSMGVQSMRDDLLLRLGRVHSRDAALKALDQIFTAGFDNVSVDLLCGVPQQNCEDLEEALQTLTQFPITHLSCYLLTLPRHHRMYSELPNEDEQLAHLLFLDGWMKDAGFQHYEISNYARSGRRARHNLAYWKGDSYLGLGPSAHSFDASTSTRWKNVSSLHKYSELLREVKSPLEWSECLTEDQKALERWMLALRLDDGFEESWLTRGVQKARAHTLKETGHLEPHPTREGYLRLTARGFALSDQIISSLSG